MKSTLTRVAGYIAVFVAGGIVGSLLFDANLSIGTSGRSSVGVSNEYVIERLAPVCDRLRANGCDCEPVLFTERTCQAQLDDLLMRQLFESQESD
jgi:hypothetical protein